MAGRTVKGGKGGRGRGRSAGKTRDSEAGDAPIANKPASGGEMTSLLRTFATSCSTRALHTVPPPPPSLSPVLFGSTRGSCSLRRAQIQISPCPHILKMSAPIYGSDETERFRLPRIQIVLFFDGFSSPENRVACAYSFLGEQTNIAAWRSENVALKGEKEEILSKKR